MKSIDHSQVQELVRQLPADKLPQAFRLLQELAEGKVNGSDQFEFMKHSLEERRRLLAEQALAVKAEYEQSTEVRQAWQVGSD